MHHKLKTSLNLIAFHQTPLFDPKKKNTWYTPADGRSYQKCQRRNFQQYLLKFADPNGSDSNVSQTTATGNLQTRNDKSEYAARRSNIHINKYMCSETAATTNVFVKSGGNYLFHAFCNDTCTFALADTGSAHSIAYAGCYKTLLYRNPIIPFFTQLRAPTSKSLTVLKQTTMKRKIN